ncbi:MAG: hypothetical protein ACM34E_01500 [Acidobacteriota bacterium]
MRIGFRSREACALRSFLFGLETRLGLTEARVTPITNLLYLAPDIQLRVLELETVDGAEPTNEKALRLVASRLRWEEQRGTFEAVARQWEGARKRPRRHGH